MHYSSHGGGCCGASHVMGFGPSPEEAVLIHNIEERIKTVETAAEESWSRGRQGYTQAGTFRTGEKGPPRWGDRDFGHLIEITLTDTQVKNWKSILKKMGFQFNRRWFNDNSGNYCSLLTWVPENVPNDPPPFDWDTDEEIVLPDPNVRVVEINSAREQYQRGFYSVGALSASEIRRAFSNQEVDNPRSSIR